MANTAIKEFFARGDVKKKFEEMLGERAPQFITSVLQTATSNRLLENADPASIYNSAAIAATLDLPINASLGFAWIVPYNGKAQFQIGWKGFVQLAQRTGEYKRINVVEVYESQFKSWNALKEELDADFTIDGSGAVVGYCAFFKLSNGFEKLVYWSREKVLAHGKKYSKSFSSGPWKDEFDKMAKKTVLKNMLSQWGILSIEMQKAFKADQAVINSDNTETIDVAYVDAPTTEVNKEHERIGLLIDDATTIDELMNLEKEVPENLRDLFNAKKQYLTNGRK